MNRIDVKRPGRYFGRWKSPLGSIVLASDGRALVGLWFEGQKFFGSTLSANAMECNNRLEFDETRRWLADYFSGTRPSVMPEIRLAGTEFQNRVWDALLTVGWGETVTYGQLATRLGSSPRAVGSAVGRNPISLIVPCHRVTGVASLTGYAAGLDIKSALLDIESRH